MLPGALKQYVDGLSLTIDVNVAPPPLTYRLFYTGKLGMTNNTRLAALLTLGMLSTPLCAQDEENLEFDFFLNFENCKFTGAPLHLAENAIITAEGDPLRMGCNRISQSIECVMSLNEEVKEVDYGILIDIPPNLMFADSRGADVISIHQTNHAAVLTSRMGTVDMLGQKVCHGTFGTSSEINAMNALKE